MSLADMLEAYKEVREGTLAAIQALREALEALEASSRIALRRVRGLEIALGLPDSEEDHAPAPDEGSELAGSWIATEEEELDTETMEVFTSKEAEVIVEIPSDSEPSLEVDNHGDERSAVI